MFETFTERTIRTSEVEISFRIGGSGPPLLLLHGYPQTGACWNKVAPALARTFTVVVPDLRGYGRSEKLAGDPDHHVYSKRAMAEDQAQVMAALGFARFAVAGHDRGGRVAHRLALDHPDRVERAAVLDIVPTLAVFEAMNQAVAMDYYHWLFLAQPHGLPEHLISLDPDFYLLRKLSSWGNPDETIYGPEALNEYLEAFRDRGTIHATCEDYRAGAGIDLVHHREDRDAGRRVACPLLVLWGRRGLMEKNFDVLATWRDVATSVRGQALDCGHFLPEEQPAETAAALAAFFTG